MNFKNLFVQKSGGYKAQSLVELAIAVPLIGLFVWALIYFVFIKPNQPKAIAIDIPQAQPYMTDSEMVDGEVTLIMSGNHNMVVTIEDAEFTEVVAMYNVDVEVPGNHAWESHNIQATNAIRCLTRNGTWIVLSEKQSRNIHLICKDPNTGKSYVAILEKIRQASSQYANATSRLITAWELIDETVEQYVKYETEIKCIIIRLQFAAGELFFAPK